MAKKVVKEELADKVEKTTIANKEVKLDHEKFYNFESNGTAKTLPKGKYSITGVMAEIFLKQGYGDICK